MGGSKSADPHTGVGDRGCAVLGRGDGRVLGCRAQQADGSWGWMCVVRLRCASRCETQSAPRCARECDAAQTLTHALRGAGAPPAVRAAAVERPLAVRRGVVARWRQIVRTKAESQRIVATRPLCRVQYPVPYSSRLQGIHRPGSVNCDRSRLRHDSNLEAYKYIIDRSHLRTFLIRKSDYDRNQLRRAELAEQMSKSSSSR